MSDALHLAALVLAAAGTCGLVAAVERRRGRRLVWAGSVVASLIMIGAMSDIVFGLGIAHPVAWAVALLAGSVAVAVGERAMLGRADAGRGPAVHTAIGGLVVIPLVLAMGEYQGAQDAARAGAAVHAHGSSGALLLLPAAAFVAWSAVLLARAGRPARERIQHGAMGASTMLMALAALG
ncbi:hypothetical protein [Microbacterium halotolerans]|uniref:hypothetical protein n=1 Tax=Microbacterium halotolerans TaxID=246613 RepID=UPI000E6AB32F|nr:hypothetical protein [Microbacterium halotolerans]